MKSLQNGLTKNWNPPGTQGNDFSDTIILGIQSSDPH